MALGAGALESAASFEISLTSVVASDAILRASALHSSCLSALTSIQKADGTYVMAAAFGWDIAFGLDCISETSFAMSLPMVTPSETILRTSELFTVMSDIIY